MAEALLKLTRCSLRPINFKTDISHPAEIRYNGAEALLNIKS